MVCIKVIYILISIRYSSNARIKSTRVHAEAWRITDRVDNEISQSRSAVEPDYS